MRLLRPLLLLVLLALGLAACNRHGASASEDAASSDPETANPGTAAPIASGRAEAAEAPVEAAPDASAPVAAQDADGRTDDGTALGSAPDSSLAQPDAGVEAAHPSGTGHASGAFGDRAGIRELLFGDDRAAEISIRQEHVGGQPAVLAVARQAPATLRVHVLAEDPAAPTQPGSTAYAMHRFDIEPPPGATHAELRTLRWKTDGTPMARIELGIRYALPPVGDPASAPPRTEDHLRVLVWDAQARRLGPAPSPPAGLP